MDRRASLVLGDAVCIQPHQTTTHLTRVLFLTTGGSRAATIAFVYTTTSIKANNKDLQAEMATHLVKNVLETLLGERGALDILDRTEFTCEALSLFRRDGPLFLPLQFLHHLRVIA